MCGEPASGGSAISYGWASPVGAERSLCREAISPGGPLSSTKSSTLRSGSWRLALRNAVTVRLGEPFDGVDEADLHAVLPREPGLADVMPLTVLEERSFGGRVAADHDDDDEVWLEVGPAVGRAPAGVLLEEGDHGVGELLSELAAPAACGLAEGRLVIRV
jgi:hypothetical protein